MEDKKREKFKKLAEARTNKILDTLRLLGNCSNKKFYTYSEQDVKQIFDTIEKELRETKARFSEIKKGKKRFVLKD